MYINMTNVVFVLLFSVNKYNYRTDGTKHQVIEPAHFNLSNWIGVNMEDGEEHIGAGNYAREIREDILH